MPVTCIDAGNFSSFGNWKFKTPSKSINGERRDQWGKEGKQTGTSDRLDTSYVNIEIQ